MASATGIPETRREDEPLLGGPGDVLQEEGKGIHLNLVIGERSVLYGVWCWC
jgi:hypothetical protein